MVVMLVASVCPFLEPNSDTSDGRYTQPANVVKNLTLSTSNTGVCYVTATHIIVKENMHNFIVKTL